MVFVPQTFFSDLHWLRLISKPVLLKYCFVYEMNEFYIIHSFIIGQMTENGYNGNLSA